MKGWQTCVSGFGLVLATALTAGAQQADVPKEAQGRALAKAAEASGTEAVETASGSCTGCSGWVWTKARECWRYESGSEERIFMYTVSGQPTSSEVDTGDARHRQFLGACESGHWLGQYWTSPTAFTNVRLWYQ
jgi:hypothetical protein